MYSAYDLTHFHQIYTRFIHDIRGIRHMSRIQTRSEIWQEDKKGERQDEVGYMIRLIDLLCISAILWRPALVVEDARVPGENHQPLASDW